MKTKGKDLLAYITNDGGSGGYKKIALSTSCDIEVSIELKRISSILSGRYSRMRPGRYSWSVSTSALVAHDDTMALELLQALIQGRELLISCNVSIAGITKRIYGRVYATSWSASAPLTSMATYKVMFTGTGPIEIDNGTTMTDY